MVVIRGTQKVLKRIRDKNVDVTVASTTALGDWYANLLSVCQARLVLLVSERSLLSVVVPARDWGNFLPPFRDAVSDLLAGLAVPSADAKAELGEMDQLRFSRTASRVVLGSMIDLTYQARTILAARPGISLGRLALELSKVPSGPIGMQYPRDVAAGLLSRPGWHGVVQ